MSQPRATSLALLALVAFCPFAASYAQTTTAAVNGIVTDPSGAVIAGAEVAVTNVETGVVTRATTDAAGAYTIRFLPIGRYSESITAPGFATEQVPAFQLEIAQAAKIDGHLSAASAATNVEVTGSAPSSTPTTLPSASRSTATSSATSRSMAATSPPPPCLSQARSTPTPPA